MRIFLIVFTASLMLLAPISYGGESLHYSGRLVNTNGSPVAGPRNLEFDLVRGSTTLCTVVLNSVALQNGVFNVELNFDSTACSGAQFSEVVGDALTANQDLYVQVTDVSGGSTTYPKQLITTAPISVFAKKVPDGSIVQKNLTGLAANCAPGQMFLATAGGGFTCGTVATSNAPSGPASGDLAGTYPSPTIKANAITTTMIVDGAVTTAKIPDAAITAAKLDQMSAVTGQALKWNGSAWQPTNDAGILSENDPTVRGFAKFNPPSCANYEILKFDALLNSGSGGLYCDTIVEEAITDGVLGLAPSEDQVFDALALKADRDNDTQTIISQTNYVENVIFTRSGNDVGQIREKAADRIGITNAADSTEHVSFNTVSGRVGIGSTSPGSKLDIVDDLASSSGTDYGMKLLPTVDQSGSASYTGLLVNVTQNTVGTGTKKLLDLQVNGVSMYYVDNTGNVTSSLSQTGTTATYTSASGPQMTLGYDTSNKVAMDVSSTGFTTFTASGTGAGYNFAGGNVGIGRANPSQALDVVGNALISGTVGVGGAPIGTGTNKMNFSLGDKLSWDDISVLWVEATGTKLQAGNNADITFLNPSGNPNMFIDSTGTGYVGIGTIVPEAKLDISQAAGDNPTFIMRDGDVAHSFTGVPADTTFRVQNWSSAGGGAYVTAYNDDGTNPAMALGGIHGVTDPTDAAPAALIWGAKSDGSGNQAVLGNSETVMQVGHGANGATKLLSVMGSGWMGLGTVSPSSKFHVAEAGAVIGLVENTASTADARLIVKNTLDQLQMGMDATGGYFQQLGANDLRTIVNGAERMRVDSTGKVGIGTNGTGSYKLHVVNGTSNAALRTETNYAASQVWKPADGANDFAEFIVSNEIGTETKYVAMGLGEGTGKRLSTAATDDAYLTTIGASNLLFGTNSTEYMRLTTSGNVGIGTVSPSYKLEAVTSGTLGARISTATSTVGQPQIDLLDSGRNQETVVTSTDGTTVGTYVASYSNHPLLFGTNASSTPTAKMAILPNGNVGIGTSTPGSILDANSTKSASSGVEYGARILPTITQSGTAGYTGLLVNATETSLGTGANKLLDLQADGVSRFWVNNTGSASFRELPANGANYVTIKSPDTLAADYTLTLPVNAGSANLALMTDGNGVLSWASLGSVGITDGSIQTDDMADGSVTTAKILNETILAEDIATGAVTTSEILDETILAGDIAAGAVTTSEILDETILAGDIAAGAVTTSEILDETILAGDIATGAVTTSEILDETILAGDIATGAVTTSEILDGTIATIDIANSAITNAKIGAQEITDLKLSGISSSCASGEIIKTNGLGSFYCGAAFTGSGTTNYIPKWSSGSNLGNSSLYDDGTTVTNYAALDVAGGSGTGYSTAPIEIATTASPRISFHWPGVVASQLGMDSSGVIRTYNNPGTGYEAFAAAAISANGNLSSSGNLTVSGIGTFGSYTTAPYHNLTAGEGYGVRFWGSDSYKISMGSSGVYQYGPVTDYSIKTQMDAGSPGRGFTWGREGVAPIAAINSTSGNMQVAGSFTSASISTGAISASSLSASGAISSSSLSTTTLSATNITASGNLTGNEVYSNSWFRSNTSGTGWYHQVHGGGIYMDDNSWVKVYNSKNFLVSGTIRATNWFESTGDTGWYNATYGGGWFMQDSTWIRAYGSKNVYTPGTILSGTHQASTFIYSSDKRLKHEVKPYTNASEKIEKLRGVRFKWNKNNKEDIGFIAQEVQKVEPDLVEKGADGWLAVKYGNVTAILVEAFKDLKKLVTKVDDNNKKMEVKLAKLAQENAELKKRLDDQDARLKKQEALIEKALATKRMPSSK